MSKPRKFNAICHVNHTKNKRKENPVYVETQDDPEASCRVGLCPVTRAANPLPETESPEFSLQTYKDNIIMLLDSMVGSNKIHQDALVSISFEEIKVAYVQGRSPEMFVGDYARRFCPAKD